MANSDKDILITPNSGSSSADPKIEYVGADSSGNDTITVETLYDGTKATLSFEGSAGQLFSIVNNLSTDPIFSVNDVSGIPSIEVDSDGEIRLAEFSGNVGIGISTPTELLHVDGRIKSNSLTLSSLSTQSSEATAVMIDGNGIIGTRELGSNAFNSTSYLTGNQTITLTGDVSGSGTTSISVTVNDDSHNHIISNVDGLQTALDTKIQQGSNAPAVSNFSNTNPGGGFRLLRVTGGTDRFNAGHHNLIQLPNSSSSGYAVQIAALTQSPTIGWRGQGSSTWSSWYEIYHEGHKPTYSELGTMAYSNLTGTPTIPSLSGYATESYVGTQISNLVDSSPAAIGDDANFSTTVTNNIATKLPLAGGTMTGALTTANSLKVTGVASSNSSPATDQVELSGYGLIGNRGNMYITNSNTSGNIVMGVSGTHNANPKLTVTTSGITVGGTVSASGGNSTNWNTAYTTANAALPKAGGTMTGTLNMGGNAFTGNNFNISGVNQISLNDPGEGIVFGANCNLYLLDDAADNILRLDAPGGFRLHNGPLSIGTTTVIDSSRNLTNIGTISSGAITSSGNIAISAGNKIQLSGATDGTHHIYHNSSTDYDIVNYSTGFQLEHTTSGTQFSLVGSTGNATFTGGITTSGVIQQTASEGREIRTYMPSSYTANDIVSGHEYGWYSDYWRVGISRSGNSNGEAFRFNYSGTYVAQIGTTGLFDGAGYRISGTTVIDSNRNLTNIGSISATDLLTQNNTTITSISGTRDLVTIGSGSRAGAIKINDVAGATYTIAGGGYDLTFYKNVSGTSNAAVMQFVGANASDSTPDVRVIHNLTVDGSITSGAIEASGRFVSTSGISRFQGGISLGTDNDVYFYESSAGQATLRTGSSGAYKYFSSRTDGYFSAPNGYILGSTVIVDGSRNLTNIGTISSGAITSSGNISGVLGTFAAPNGVTGSVLINGGNTSVSANGEINSELNFGSNDGSATGNIGGSIKSVTEASNGAYVGMAFYTTRQSRSPVLQEAVRISNDGNLNLKTGALQINGTTVIDSSRNLTNIALINSATITATSGSDQRVLKLRQASTNTGNIIQFLDQADANQWELVARNNGFYIYKNTGTGSGYKYQISSSGSHTFTGNATFNSGFISANDRIEVTKTTGNAGIKLISANTATSYVDFGDPQDTNIGLIAYDHSNNEMFIHTNATEALRLDASQNASFAGSITSTVNNYQLRLRRADSADDDWKFYSWESGLNIFPASASSVFFGRDGASTDVSVYNGNLKIGTTTVIDSSRNLTNIGTISTSAAMGSSPSNIIYMAMSGTNTNGGGGAIRFDTSASNTDTTKFYSSVEGIRATSGGGSGQLAFFTTKNGVNGDAPTRKMTIDEDGNVGIGNSSPQQRLTVGAGSGSELISIYAGTGSASGIHFTDTNTSGDDFQGFVTYDHTADALRFGTAEAERMRIDSSGKVGIGTTSPDEKLEVVGGVTSNFYGFNAVNSLTPSDTVYISAPRSANLGLFTASTERLTVDGSGNVGIGATSPGYKLDVGGSVRFSGSASIVGTLQSYSGAFNVKNISQDQDLNLQVNDGGTNTTALTVQGTTANVGIGTSSPSTQLHVKGASIDDGALAYIENTYASGGTMYPALKAINTLSNHSYGVVAEFITAGATGTDRPSILFSNGHTNLNWQVGQGVYSANDNFSIGYRSAHPGSGGGWATSRLTITTTGNVGIGTTSPSQKLHVDGTILVNNEIQFVNDQMRIYRSNDDMRIRAGSTDRITILSDGKVGLKTTAPDYTLDVNGDMGVNEYIYHNDDGNTYLRFLVDRVVIAAGGRWIIDCDEGTDPDILKFMSDAQRAYSDGTFHAKGDIIAYSTTTTSDRRLKKNIQPLENSLEKVQKLQGVSFDWKDEDKGSSIGFIAQDFEKELPDLIKEVRSFEDKDDTIKTINYGNTVALLVEAIKEQQEQINELTKQVQDLKEK